MDTYYVRLSIKGLDVSIQELRNFQSKTYEMWPELKLSSKVVSFFQIKKPEALNILTVRISRECSGGGYKLKQSAVAEIPDRQQISQRRINEKIDVPAILIL